MAAVSAGRQNEPFAKGNHKSAVHHVLVDLIRVTTADGIRLDGALRMPPAGQGPQLFLDAVLLLHGTGANFYASSLLEAIAEHFVSRGVAALSANTRGHDILYTAGTSDGPRRLGAACERVDDCRWDVAAWLDGLTARGYRRIGLVGHSLGAIKGVYAVAQHAIAQPDAPSVAWLCAVSPARLSYEYFCGSPAADEFRATLSRAQQLVDEGHGETLIEVDFPIPYVVAAAGYLDKYGPGERFNVQTYVGRLRVPTLFTFGSAEVQSHVAFRGLPEAIESAAQDPIAPNPLVQVAVIAGGDHVYSGVRSELLARIQRWLGRIP
jgi:pimeloyl-ACP methyl ester carboxylesterase